MSTCNRRRFGHRLGLATLLVLWSPSLLAAQERLWFRKGDVNSAGFGEAMAPWVDADGDGLVDVLVAEVGAPCDTPGTSKVHLLAGDDGGELEPFCFSPDLPAYAEEICRLGDVDGDGVVDLAFGNPYHDQPDPGSDAGAVFVISGATRELLYSRVGELSFARFGFSLAAIDDVDEDGAGDLLVGSPSFEPHNEKGAAYVYSARTGALLRSYYGVADSEALGANVSRLGDLDADGMSDYAITAWLGGSSNTKGRVVACSGATGTELMRWEGSGEYTGFGRAIADIGDFDRDGHDDLLVGAAFVDKTAGAVYCYSGATGGLLFELRGDRRRDSFGVPIVNLGDMNGDTFPEILVGANSDDHDGPEAGAAFLFSLKTLRPLYRFYPGFAGGQQGWRIGGGADLDGDGIPDGLVAMAHTLNNRGKPFGKEAVFAFAGNDLFLQASDPQIAPGEVVTLETRGGEPGALTLLVLVDVSGTKTFLPLALATLDSNGEASFEGCAPDDSLGLDFTLRAWAQKHADGSGGIIDSGKETVSVR